MVRQEGARARGMPSVITEQLATEVIPLLMMGWTELPPALVAPTLVGATPSVETLPTQAEVAATVIGET